MRYMAVLRFNIAYHTASLCLSNLVRRFDFSTHSMKFIHCVSLACSSSLLALDCALRSLRSEACDAAVVVGE
jgi:hypothetical protein